MNFPDWAPALLVWTYNHYPHPREYPGGEYPPCPSDPDGHIAQLLEEDEQFKQMSKQRQENYRTSLHRTEFALPPEKGKELLGKLITDLRMKPVWASLSKRSKEEVQLLYFWHECERAILGWLGAQKLSPKQRRDHFLKMHHHALELLQMMYETEEFHNYSIMDLISTESINSLQNVLNLEISRPGGEDDIDELRRFFLAEGAPSIYQILRDVADKSLQFSKKTPLVRKPNSDNAAIHYFVRKLSRYLKEEYGTPLHEVVAATAGVVFDQPEIDLDYVSKLVKN
ncbi:hypothetical protein SAMN05216299_109122 [Nitrosospira sp. Nsp14]|uniref:hypothetical protein n=1 Tax=Nitrosospira sp. Nsp14 TaxID=1855333 RepID=UPI0008E35B66|nr:hypothetical protein [Nitrosospira sp. Nsp14]SFH38328.1 hypothetical protein SAMN05216299_109122 [Nitrosospira sp. Nsp14]